jgi:hypothetical protein
MLTSVYAQPFTPRLKHIVQGAGFEASFAGEQDQNMLAIDRAIVALVVGL